MHCDMSIKVPSLGVTLQALACVMDRVGGYSGKHPLLSYNVYCWYIPCMGNGSKADSLVESNIVSV